MYTLHAVEFAPPLNPDVSSIFDDPSDDIRQTWERAEEMGDLISSAGKEEVGRRLREARQTVREVMQKVSGESARRQKPLLKSKRILTLRLFRACR